MPRRGRSPCIPRARRSTTRIARGTGTRCCRRSATQAVLVIDMNGNVVKRWEGFNNSAGGPARVLPGGVVIAASGARPPHQESTGADPARLRRQGRSGSSRATSRSRRARAARSGRRVSTTTGSGRVFQPATTRPRATPAVEGGNTLILTHADRTQPKVADVLLEDDRLIEVSWKGDIVWEWLASDHIDELGFAPDARKAIKAARGFNKAPGQLRLAARQLGDLCRTEPMVRSRRHAFRPEPRHHQQPRSEPARDRRPRRLRSSGGSVPTSAQSQELRAIRQIIGQHHAHLIPKGLPGAGNLLVFDNGGSSGYGFANPIAPDGTGRVCARRRRACSRSTR